MYFQGTGRPAKIKAKAFNREQVIEKATDQLIGIRVVGVTEKDAEPEKGVPEPSLTISYKQRRGRIGYATAFGEDNIALVKKLDLSEGAILNLEGLPTTSPFRVPNSDVVLPPRMFKILNAEQGDPSTIVTEY